MASATKPAAPYLVLARKYRPGDFDALIGQDALVQTLTNAFSSGRIHHAYILTGVRGVGKTTTARILARAFNYASKEGAAPTLELSKPGDHCQAIIEGRHVDVIEMDAASNTGIDDIREIIDSVKYGPASAPYKVYIIDEVHMLSKQAFNGLLKTLEEPPPYVKFIFATTEIRKVPVTILSRCQRFDLRRVAPGVMRAHLEKLLKKENIEFEPEALSMIIRAGEGSVRDCLSLSDQAIAHGDGHISASGVAGMLGLADRGRSIDLFEALMQGDIAKALDLMRSLYDGGADPATIIADLAEFTHLVTRIKVVPATVDDPSLTPHERSSGTELAAKLGMRVLTRTWQILQGGHEEVAKAALPIQAAEMVLVRLAYAADLPTPDELIEKLGATPGQAPDKAPGAAPNTAPPRGAGPPGAHSPADGGSDRSFVPLAPLDPAPTAPAPAAPAAEAQTPAIASPQNFAELVALAAEKRDLLLKHALETDVRPISFEAGRLEIALTRRADKSVVSLLSSRLQQWTGRTWMVSVSNEKTTSPTLREQAEAVKKDLFDEARADPLVKEILATFPQSELVEVREQAGIDKSDDGKDDTTSNRQEKR